MKHDDYVPDALDPKYIRLRDGRTFNTEELRQKITRSDVYNLRGPMPGRPVRGPGKAPGRHVHQASYHYRLKDDPEYKLSNIIRAVTWQIEHKTRKDLVKAQAKLDRLKAELAALVAARQVDQ